LRYFKLVQGRFFGLHFQFPSSIEASDRSFVQMVATGETSVLNDSADEKKVETVVGIPSTGSYDEEQGTMRETGMLKDGIRIHPIPTTDPLDPLNFPRARKLTCLGIVMSMCKVAVELDKHAGMLMPSQTFCSHTSPQLPSLASHYCKDNTISAMPKSTGPLRYPP
jgi:hypothetical protein